MKRRERVTGAAVTSAPPDRNRHAHADSHRTARIGNWSAFGPQPDVRARPTSTRSTVNRTMRASSAENTSSQASRITIALSAGRDLAA
jgi:hypothetical protein